MFFSAVIFEPSIDVIRYPGCKHTRMHNMTPAMFYETRSCRLWKNILGGETGWDGSVFLSGSGKNRHVS